MPAVARGGVDIVQCIHGHYEPNQNIGCQNPGPFLTALCSTDVLVVGVGAVRVGDLMQSHPNPATTPIPCLPHAPALSTGSATVMVNGQPIGRVGDLYTAGHVIFTVNQGTVTAGG